MAYLYNGVLLIVEQDRHHLPVIHQNIWNQIALSLMLLELKLRLLQLDGVEVAFDRAGEPAFMHLQVVLTALQLQPPR